eukprot:Anaeramoba_ignava/a90141_120.p7 GENE.a90141_120~~a90141_120.p7  ORF type:complete len:235 (-),score=10.66 a90141_120:5776-6480(-)
MKKSSWNAKRVLKLFANAIFYAIIVGLMVFSIANMKVKREDNIANIFGMGMLSVQTDSMKGTFEAGDMIFVNMLDEADIANLEPGDIVTYFDMSLHAFNTHEVVSVNIENRYLITRARYNYVHPGGEITNDQPVSFDNVIAQYNGGMIAGLGSSLDYLQTSTGFALFIILPVLLVLIFEGVILVRHFMAINREKIEQQYKEEQAQVAQNLESERERMRAEILAEMKKEKALHIS